MPNKAQRDLIFKSIGYTPGQEQESIHDSLARIRLVAGGERGGKSLSSSADFMTRVFLGKLYWLVAADYERTRPEFEYICSFLDKMGMPYEATKPIDPGEILVYGGIKIATKSAKDPRRLVAEAPDGILGCEASQLDYETYLRLRGRLSEKRGWMLLSGTFESSLGWYPEMWQRGQVPTAEFASFSLPTWSNLAIFPGGRQDPEILAMEREMPADWFMERCGGIPCPPHGLVFPEFKTSVHTGIGKDFEFDSTQDVHLWVDPGYAHYCAVEVVQKRGQAIYIVDEVYQKGLVTADIVTVCQKKPWWNRVVGGTIDIAGTQHQAMPAPAEIWLQEGQIYLNSQKVSIQDGIDRFKTFLKIDPLTNRPGVFINAKCKGLISELGGCPNPDDGQTKVYKWKTDRNGVVVSDTPEDKNNDACKAVCYGIVDLMGFSNTQRRGQIKFF